MSDSHLVPFEFIDNVSKLELAVRDIASETVIALDTESNSRHHYPEQLCLVQIATRRRIYILDALTIADLLPLQKILADSNIQKVIHGADYDLRCFDRHYSFRIHNLYDTSVAARFAGITEFGLAALLKNLLGIVIPKNEQIQQADWGRRPLSAVALDYAAGDVLYLIALHEKLDRRLRELNREHWVAEECARLEEVRYNPPDLQTAFLSVKGSHTLDGRGLAVLRSLVQFREEESIRQGRPPFFVIPDFALIALAADPEADLNQVAGLGAIGLKRFGSSLRSALQAGRLAPPVDRPQPVFYRLNQPQSQRLTGLKSWRAGHGLRLQLDPSLLWPTLGLERLARQPSDLDSEISSDLIRSWQREQFAASLRSHLNAGF
jgi:ribonuclease D